MTTTEAVDQQQKTIDASLAHPFRFKQGASLHAGILGMVERPSGPHDEAPFVSGTSHSGRSQCELDLSQLQESDQGGPALHVWFGPENMVLDISPAFAGVPAEALEGSGIPPAVITGPVSADRHGDSGDGVGALLMQMCAGKIVIDPNAMLRLIASVHLEGFAQHEVTDEQPVRAFNAQMSIAHFLDEVGITSTTLVNQIAILGYDLRRELGDPALAALTEFLSLVPVQLAWFVDESDRIHTAQVMVTLTDFINQIFTNEHVIAQIAEEENRSVDEMRDFVEKSAEAGRLVYVHAIWQTFDFDNEIVPLVWPEAQDLTGAIAAQACRLRSTASVETDHVTVDPDMVEHMCANSGAIQFVLSNVEGDAFAAAQKAQALVQMLRHPDEPTETLASFLSDVIETENGAQFWADISDMEDEPEVLEAVVDAVVSAVASVVASAHLSATVP